LKLRATASAPTPLGIQLMLKKHRQIFLRIFAEYNSHSILT
jgi:hypothetical protein